VVPGSRLIYDSDNKTGGKPSRKHTFRIREQETQEDEEEENEQTEDASEGKGNEEGSESEGESEEEESQPLALPYKNAPLSGQQFRLLTILDSGSPYTEAPILCRLSVFSFQSAPAYTALSYTWGKSEPATAISLNGTFFEVGPNLATFLRYERCRQDASKYLWIDALCIDQTNADEMNHQVPFMSRIYGNAEKVLVWLGDPVETVADAALTSLSIRNTRRLFMKSYWSRLWIVQEIMFARSIVVRYGTAQMDWPYFASFIESNDPLCLLKVSRIVRLKKEFYSGSPTLHTTFSLYSLMTEFGSSRASRIHDKIFALSGLVTTGPSIQVDYGLSRHRLAAYTYHIIDDSS
jgi:hypothetical protein